MENEGMRITVVGAALIVAAVIGVFLLIRYLNRGTEQPGSQEGNPPPQ